MKSDYLVYGILAVVFGLVIYTVYTVMGDGAEEPIAPIAPAGSASGFKTITSGDTETGNVQIDLTPIGTENGQLKVNIAVNTHSVDLSQYDLKKITALEYDGKKTNPIFAPQLSGHHAPGTLIFNVNNEINAFKITIFGIPSVQERVFEWK